MKQALFFSLFAFTVLYITLLLLSLRIRSVEDKIQALKNKS